MNSTSTQSAAARERPIAFYDEMRRGAWSLATEQIMPSNRIRFRHIRRLLAKHDARGDLLDVGCGAGALINLLKRDGRFTRLEGCDFSSEAIRIAKAHHEFDFFVADLTQPTDFGMGRHDTITCSEVLEHIDDLQAATNTIFALLRPGGIVVITVPFGMKHWSSTDEFAGHVRRFEPGLLEDAVKVAGGEVLEQFVWGRFVYDLYYRMFLSRANHERLLNFENPIKRTLKGLASRILYLAFRIDDLFISQAKGRRLFLVARRSAGDT